MSGNSERICNTEHVWNYQRIINERKNKIMKTFRAFEVKYIGATNTKGSRIRITDCRFEESAIIDYDYSCNSSTDIAIKYLELKGIEICGQSEHSKIAGLLFSENFTTRIK